MSKFFLALVTYGLLLQIGLVSAAPRIRVLTVGADKCTPRKQAALKTAIAEAIQLADAAVTALANPQVVGSKAFTDFLGEGNDRNAISAKNFQSVKSILSTELFTLTGITGAAERDIVFICPPDKEELAKVPLENDLAPTSKEKCGGTFFAIARNGPPNIVKLCPIFFDKRQRKNGKTGVVEDIIAQPLDNAKKLYLAGDRIGGVPAIAILHELQHLQLVVGPEIAVDLPSKIDPVAGPPPPPDPSLKLPKVENPAYSVDQCKGLLPQFKIQNAQNFAWFAMDVFSDKTRGLPCGAPPSPSTPVASGSGSGSGSNSPRPGSPKPASPKTPTKPIARRAPPKVAAPKAAKPKAPAAAAPKKAAPAVAAKPKPAVAKPAPVAVKPKPIAAKPVAAKPAPATVKPKPATVKPKPAAAKPAPIAAKPAPVAAKPAPVAAKPAPAAAKPKPKPNPLGGGTAPSGPRLARPARLSSSASKPSPTKTTTGTGAKNGAKVGTGAKTTSTGVKKPTPTPPGKVSPAPATCKVIRRGVIHPISADGTFVP